MSHSYVRARENAIKQYSRRRFNDSPTIKQMKWARYLWLMGVRWSEIRKLYNLRDATLLAILKMPENWEAKAA